MTNPFNDEDTKDSLINEKGIHGQIQLEKLIIQIQGTLQMMGSLWKLIYHQNNLRTTMTVAKLFLF